MNKNARIQMVKPISDDLKVYMYPQTLIDLIFEDTYKSKSLRPIIEDLEEKISILVINYVSNGILDLYGEEKEVYKHPKSEVQPDVYNTVTTDGSGHIINGENVNILNKEISLELLETLKKVNDDITPINILERFKKISYDIGYKNKDIIESHFTRTRENGVTYFKYHLLKGIFIVIDKSSYNVSGDVIEYDDVYEVNSTSEIIISTTTDVDTPILSFILGNKLS